MIAAVLAGLQWSINIKGKQRLRLRECLTLVRSSKPPCSSYSGNFQRLLGKSAMDIIGIRFSEDIMFTEYLVCPRLEIKNQSQLGFARFRFDIDRTSSIAVSFNLHAFSLCDDNRIETLTSDFNDIEKGCLYRVYRYKKSSTWTLEDIN